VPENAAIYGEERFPGFQGKRIMKNGRERNQEQALAAAPQKEMIEIGPRSILLSFWRLTRGTTILPLFSEILYGHGKLVPDARFKDLYWHAH
jgi:hypothetical protein